MKIALKETIQQIDKLCFEKYGIPTLLLMENAGEQVYLFIKNKILDYKNKKYLLVCGIGNNGGDGLVCVRKLFIDGVEIKILFIENPQKIKGDALINFNIIDKIGIPYFILENDNVNYMKELIKESDIIIDSIFGIGFHGEFNENIKQIVKEINNSEKTVISIDIPSGLNANSFNFIEAVKANYTITFGLPKLSMFDFPSREYIGERIVCNINIPNDLLNNSSININLITTELIKNLYKIRKRNTYKNNYGHILIIGGKYENSQIISGALYLAGISALRAGCGLLTIASCEKIINNLIPLFPESMFLELNYDNIEYEKKLINYISEKKINCILIGNGLGIGKFQENILKLILKLENIKKIVIDADGLNNISLSEELKEILKYTDKEIILTPHIGEFSRLTNKNIEEIKKNKIEILKQINLELKKYIILKDSISYIINPEQEIWINETGSVTLAKAGSGDILAGLIAGLFTSGYNPTESCIIGSYILGRIGEIYEKKYDKQSSIARDIINFIPEIFNEIENI